MLSFKEELKIMQVININIVVFLAFSLVFDVIFGVRFENFVFITICLSSIGVYLANALLKNKIENIKVITIIAAVFVVGTFFYKYDVVSAIIYGIYSALLIWYTIENENTSISYSANFTLAKGIVIFSLVMLVIYFFRGEAYFNSVINYYFILIPLNIMILRMSRAIGSEIEDKNMRKINLVIIISIFMLITKRGQEVVSMIFHMCTTVLGFITEKLLLTMFAILYYPAIWIGNGIEYLFKLINNSGYSQESTEIIAEKGDFESILEAMAKEQSYVYDERFIAITKIIIVIIIAIVIFLVFKRLMSNKKEEGYEEIVETIEDIQKKHAFRDRLKEFVNRDKSIRGRILFAYKRFVIKCENKGIYKEKFTATELVKEVSKKANSNKELENIRDIYNETKYSNHNIEECKAETMEESVSEINKKIGGRENGDK